MHAFPLVIRLPALALVRAIALGLTALALLGCGDDPMKPAGFPCVPHYDGGVLGRWQGVWSPTTPIVLTLELEEESPVVQSGRRFGVRLAGHASLGGPNRIDSLEVRHGYALCESGEVLVLLESILHAAPNTLVLSGRRAWWEGATTTHLDLAVGPNELDIPEGTFRMIRLPQ